MKELVDVEGAKEEDEDPVEGSGLSNRINSC